MTYIVLVCKTPSHGDGMCQPHDTCPIFKEILGHLPISDKDLTMIIDSKCETSVGKPFLCCPIQEKEAIPSILATQKNLEPSTTEPIDSNGQESNF